MSTTSSSASAKERPRISRAAISAWKRLRCLIARVNRPLALPWLVIGLLAGAGWHFDPRRAGPGDVAERWPRRGALRNPARFSSYALLGKMDVDVAPPQGEDRESL